MKPRTSKKKPSRQRTLPAGYYSQKDVCRVLPVTPAQIEYWARSHVLQPQLSSSGRGDYRYFSFANLVEIEICRRVTALGLAVHECLGAILKLQHLDPEDSLLESPRQRAAFANMKER